MYDELNYEELEELAGDLLVSVVGKSHDDPNAEERLKRAMAVVAELDRRENVAIDKLMPDIATQGSETPIQHLQRRRKWIAAVIAVAILVVIVIACSSCQLVQGVGGDITWMGRAGQEALEHGHELK